jgi:hypothetical protein
MLGLTINITSKKVKFLVVGSTTSPVLKLIGLNHGTINKTIKKFSEIILTANTSDLGLKSCVKKFFIENPFVMLITIVIF